MWHALLPALLIIAVAIIFLSVRLFFRKGFVHTHIDGNKARNDKGIHCALSYDGELRAPKKHAVPEKSGTP